MRIISGSLRGREIRAPKGDETRPAMARTRASLFSMLEARALDWPRTRVLDLFAGAGSLAFEALSRGANCAILVDNSPNLGPVMAVNIARLDLVDRCSFLKDDCLRFLRRPPLQPFNLVFVDPPYRRDYASPILKRLVENDWLAPGAYVAAELEKGAKIVVPNALLPETERPFGQTVVKIWKKN